MKEAREPGSVAKGSSAANLGYRIHGRKAAEALPGRMDSGASVHTRGWTFHLLLAMIRGKAPSAVGGLLRR
ncbi:MAG: hypothetical protein Kow00109_13540 [Acidobacteriota bacterium]